MLEVGQILNSPTIEKLKGMKLKVMAQMLADPESSVRDLSFEDRLALMVDAEWFSKRNAKIKRLIKSVTLAVDACIGDIRYQPDRTIDKRVVQTLSACTYIEQKLNIVVFRAHGNRQDIPCLCIWKLCLPPSLQSKVLWDS
jgi:hypothetical protein